jgi:hypothetical protein
VSRNADVTGPATMRAIGAASQRLGLTVRVVYFSNAEFFFPYSPQFQENVRGLPTDARTVLLRTFRQPGAVVYPQNDTWAYMVHPYPDFLERLAMGYRRQRQIVWDALRNGFGGQYTRDQAIVVTRELPRRSGLRLQDR